MDYRGGIGLFDGLALTGEIEQVTLTVPLTFVLSFVVVKQHTLEASSQRVSYHCYIYSLRIEERK